MEEIKEMCPRCGGQVPLKVFQKTFYSTMYEGTCPRCGGYLFVERYSSNGGEERVI